MIWRSKWYPRTVFVVCLMPLAYLSWRWYRHDLTANSVEYVARFLGIWALRLLLATLAITPLRRIPGLAGLIRIRRMLGLFTYFYGFLHGLHYFVFDVQWNWLVIKDDLTFRRFFIAGMVTLLLLTPLAATSFDAAIRWMGGRRWQRLHRLIYLAGITAVVHYCWQGKGITNNNLFYAGMLLILLAARVVYVAWKRYAKRQIPIPYAPGLPPTRSEHDRVPR
jgi:methionine sulfoxide reductase heme-binding subunit